MRRESAAERSLPHGKSARAADTQGVVTTPEYAVAGNCSAGRRETLLRSGRGLRLALIVVCGAVLGACATLPPGASYPKISSIALEHPEETRLGGEFLAQARAHSGFSGFHILALGVDGFQIRAQMIDAAERTLDVQYFIFRGDDTGRLLTDALLRAADRGVRVRVLIDDGDTIAGDEQIVALNVHPSIELRIFNPFGYRGHSSLRRGLEILSHSERLDRRMHNKLLVVDNSVALVGGRNIGNEYFQVDPDAQFADDDVFAVGPVAAELSGTFDEFWNSRFAIPADAFVDVRHGGKALAAHRERARWHPAEVVKTSAVDGTDYVTRIASGEPYAGLISGRVPLVWAASHVVCDSPEKERVVSGSLPGRLMARDVIERIRLVQSELLMVTPYLVPSADELTALQELRARGATVRILTNSFESSKGLLVHAGYARYRRPLLRSGVELYEARALIGSAKGSGETSRLSRYGTYGLHAKLFVFDREKVFIGSMNFDKRSKHLNTEVGVIIDSPELAVQVAARFQAMVQPQNAYALGFELGHGATSRLEWHTQEKGVLLDYHQEPGSRAWQRLAIHALSHVPVTSEL
jgi:putative cardiolipin synthase